MASRVILLCVSVVLAAAAAAEAMDFVVGGANDAWKAPAQPEALAKWASANRFQVGDKLVFKLDGAADSVLEVTRDDYNRCSTTSPLAVHKADAGAVATVPLPRSGPYYFVGGAPGSCQKGERLLLVVMSEKHDRGRLRGHAPAPAPAPEQAAESPFAASFVGGPAAAPAPASGAGGGEGSGCRECRGSACRRRCGSWGPVGWVLVQVGSVFPGFFDSSCKRERSNLLLLLSVGVDG